MIRMFLAANGHLTHTGVAAAFFLLFVVVPALTGGLIVRELRRSRS